MKAYIQFVVKYRFFVLGFLLLVTLLAGAILSKVEFAGSMADLFLGESPKFYRYLELNKEFGSDSLIIIAFEHEDMLGAENIERLKKAVDRIEANPQVKDVKSILDFQDIRLENGFPTAFSYVDRALKNPARSEELLDQLRSNKLAGGLLISEDGRHALVAIELVMPEKRSDKDAPKRLQEILGIFLEAGFQRDELHQAGHIPMLVEMMHQAQFNIKRLFPLVCLVLFVVVYLLFQRFWPVFITLLVTLIGVTWTMAFAVLLFKNLNVMTAMAPGIIMIIAFSDVIHLCSSYHMEISKGEWKDQAILKSCSEVGTACLFTSITTFFGFISLAIVPSPGARQLGVSLGVGVGLSLLIAMTLTPIIFSLMKAPKPLRVGGTSKAQFFLYRAIDFVVKITRTRPWAIVTLFVLIIVFTIAGVTRIKFKHDVTEGLGKNNPFYLDSLYFAEHFAGTNYLDVFIEVPQKGGIINSDLISSIDSFQKKLLDIPEVDKVLSVFDLLGHIHSRLRPASGKGEAAPLNVQEVNSYLYMLRMSDRDALKTMIGEDNQTVKIRLNLTEGGFFISNRVTQEVSALAESHFNDPVQVEITGITALLGEWVEGFIRGQKLGLIFAFVMIFIMMTIALRSISGGLWSMLPNVIPILFLGGYVGWLWGTIDSDILFVGIIAIGIAVDDSIHFLFRYRHEREQTDDIDIALDKTFHFSGRAIIITSIILVAGFLPFALSSFFSVKIYGTLLPITLAVAMITDMLLIPALIKLGAFKFKKRLDNG